MPTAGSTLLSEKTPEVEIPLFDIEEQLADHLVIERSARELYRGGITPDYLLADRGKKGEWRGAEKHGAQLLEYVREYMDKNGGEPPTATMIVTEFPFQPNEPVVPIEFLIEKMKDRYLLGRMDEILTLGVRGIGTLGVTGKLEERKRAIRALRNDMDELLRDVQTGEVLGLNVADWRRNMAEYDRMMEDRGEGVTFGCPQIDRKIGKLNGLTFLIGRPKQGKSWFLLWSFLNALLEGKRAVFFSLEMPAWEMEARFQALATNTTYRGKTLGWTEQDRAQVEMEMTKLEDAGVLNAPIIHLGPGQRSVSNLLEIAKQNDADIMYIDQYSFLSDELTLVEGVPTHELHSRLCTELKNATNEVPIYIAAQFNRDSTKLERPEEMANLEHIGLSDQIGQKADTIMGLWQTTDMKNNTPPFIQLRVLESRSRGMGAWYLYTEYEESCHIGYKEEVRP